MADPVCSFCGEENGIFIFTNLMEGDTKVLGPQCLIGTALSLAASVTTDMSPDLAEAYGALFDQIAANDTRPKRVIPQNAPGKRRKPGATEQSEVDTPGTSSTPQDSLTSHSDGSPTQPCAACGVQKFDHTGDNEYTCVACGVKYSLIAGTLTPVSVPDATA